MVFNSKCNISKSYKPKSYKSKRRSLERRFLNFGNLRGSPAPKSRCKHPRTRHGMKTTVPNRKSQEQKTREFANNLHKLVHLFVKPLFSE